MQNYITVKDILQRRHFENIVVAGGESGLNRIVKWVHVVEVTNIRNLLKGNELILSTGVGWKEQPELFKSILEQLVECKAAGLCIEIGTYTSKIPQEAIDLANEHQFPLILFQKEVPFVEITQDIHSLLINRQYKMVSELENYSQLLNKQLLTTEHYQEILKCIQEYLNVQAAIVFNEKEIHSIAETNRLELRKFSYSTKSKAPYHFSLTFPIQLLGKKYADLMIFSKDRPFTEFDQLILDRTGTAIAQLFLREMYVQEKRKVEESDWMTSWLKGEETEETITEYLTDYNQNRKPKGTVVCLCTLDCNIQYSNIDLTYFKLFVRTIFEQQGYSIFALEKRNTIVFICLNERKQSTWKRRMKDGIYELSNSDLLLRKWKQKPIFAIGKYTENIANIHNSYQTAKEAIRIQERLSIKDNMIFYDELHVFRIISKISSHVNLLDFIHEYLKPVMDYDKKYNGKLMETLKMYLLCNGSKQETAKRLFIVRQTLYHRLQKLEKLLGEDFMETEKRVTIEFLILANEYLHPAEDKKEIGSEFQ